MKICGGFFAAAIALLLCPGCSHATKPKPVAVAAPVHGRVSFVGAVPEPRVVPVPAHLRPVFPDGLAYHPLTVNADGGLAEVLVHVVNPPAKHSRQPAPPVTLLVSNTVCQPRVLAVQTNQEVRFQFAGRQLLNISATARANPGFNFAVARDGQQNTRRFALPDRHIRISDNVHPWLRADISVFDHPWFAVTDASGRFLLPPLPPGRYELEAIHRRGGTSRVSIEVSGEPVTAELVLTGSSAQAARE